jgi:exopolysaccharide biosynthesis polyprenyl glycosylphosphotransferase
VTVVGLVLPNDEPVADGSAPGPPVLGAYGDLAAAIARSQATDLVLADRRSLNGHLRGVMDACRTGGVALKIVVTDAEVNGDAVSYVPGLDCPLYVVRPRPATRGSYLVKQVVDRLTAALLLALLSPVLLAVALAVMLTSRGPVLFVDERVGIGQRPFRCYKFRTMQADAAEAQAELEEANEAGDVLFKIRDDPRVTPVGKVLRRLSLDELPQLINVLKGDMSLVGPRPLPLRDCALMNEAQRQRHVVLPGLTGLWQVSGRSRLDFCDMLRLDLQYIETWSVKSDLYILWRTAGAVVHSRGAY